MMYFLFWMLPAAYLLGSIPTAVWTGRIFHNVDVREHGSGNAGATNVMRVLGVKTGIPVLLIDMLKGMAAVFLIRLQDAVPADKELYMILSLVLGVLAVTGHVFPVFAGFRGGKGVATIAGVCFALHLPATALALAVFMIVLFAWQYVSLGSLAAALSYPVWIILVFQVPHISLWVFSVLVALLIVVTHRKNIRRLTGGTEPKAGFLFRKRN